MLTEGRGKQHVCMGKGANRMLVERESTNGMLVEGEGKTGFW